MATVILSGAAFGAAMMAAGFHNPSIVIAQMKFENFHMLQAFLAATASSAAYYAIAERLNYVKLNPRSSSPLGLFGRYDGNIVGGALLGAGMALSGSCPGTLYAQVAAGVRTGFHALDGAILGGLLWTGFLSKVVKKNREQTGSAPTVVAIDESLGLSRGVALLVLEAACLSILAITVLTTPKFPGVKFIGAVGGLLIGLSQLISLAIRKSMLGVSSSYEEVGNYFWWLVKGADANNKPQSYRNILLGASITVGAWSMLQAVPSLAAGAAVFEVPPYLAMAGGVLMAVGARMAGGCTSGHGISGISLLSVSSIITVASMFAAGMLVAPVVWS